MKESECLILERIFLLSDVAATKESRDVREVTIDVFAFRESWLKVKKLQEDSCTDYYYILWYTTAALLLFYGYRIIILQLSYYYSTASLE